MRAMAQDFEAGRQLYLNLEQHTDSIQSHNDLLQSHNESLQSYITESSIPLEKFNELNSGYSQLGELYVALHAGYNVLLHDKMYQHRNMRRLLMN